MPPYHQTIDINEDFQTHGLTHIRVFVQRGNGAIQWITATRTWLRISVVPGFTSTVAPLIIMEQFIRLQCVGFDSQEPVLCDSLQTIT